ncbi:MAG: MutS-related protein, partial [Peptostreptococcus anaerobius]
GRHPVIEQIMGQENFIANKTSMNDNNKIHIITGPNMSGKSTYMRQTALICLMAHIGSFVPASSARIPILDRIFTRVGASDDLSQGQSTFMVEMDEVSQILKNATKYSLIILDEVGRGTSTYDGISLAWSIVEYIHDRIGAKTLFATHYHELTDLENTYDNIKNYSVDVKEDGDDIIFLRKIVDRAADRSYGIYVAKLAKLPDDLIKRADSILKDLEKNHLNNSESISQATGIYPKEENEEEIRQLSFDFVLERESKKNIPMDEQIDLSPYKDIISEIKNIDMMNTTPLQLMNILYQLQDKAKKIK